MVIKRISSNKCSRVRLTRGSRKSAKCFMGLSISPSHRPKPFLHMAIKMRLPWPNGLWFDQVGKRDRGCLHGLLRQSIEKFASRFGSAAVESEGELVEIVVEVGMRYRSLRGAEQPSFQQRNHAMDAREQVFSRL